MPSMPRHRISPFPRGSTVRCSGCGKEGTTGQITGHTGRSKSCRGARVILVAPPAGVNHVATPVSQARAAVLSEAPPPPPPADAVEVPERVREDEGLGMPDEDPPPPEDDDPDGGDDDEEEVAELVESGGGAGRATGRSTGRAPSRRPRLGRRPILRPPPPGAARVEEPVPTMSKIEVELWASTVARFDAARFDPDLGFEGTLSEFLNEVVEVHFSDCLGLDLQLRRRSRGRMVAA